MLESQKALLIDIGRCIGCRECVQACLDLHGFGGDAFKVDQLSADAFTALVEVGELYVRRLCMHCVEPSCASVCPVGALRKTSTGPVVYDAGSCLGCRYCVQACPFNGPRYEWDHAVPSVAKCDMCADRQQQGLAPACAEACPAGATMFGDRDELLAEAHRRIDADPGAYYPRVYGETEIGGTSVLMLAPVSFAGLGLPETLGDEPLPQLTGAALKKVPDIAIVGGALLWSIWWITHRREEVAAHEAANDARPGALRALTGPGRVEPDEESDDER